MTAARVGRALAVTAMGVVALTATPAPPARALPSVILGSRSVTSVGAVALTAHLGDTALSGSLTTTITEAGRTGETPWSVSASVSALSDGAGHSLAATTMSISNRQVTQTAGGGTAVATTGTQDFSQARTLFTSTGQNPALTYTGTYTATATITLTPPNLTVVGVYTGTMTITMVQ
jgi:hypothetical protein